MIVFDIPKVILQFWEKVKNLIFLTLTVDDVYGLYMYALETWYMLYGHGICSWKMGYAVWTWKMSCCWRRIYVLYIQYMYCTYSTCTVHTVHVLYIQYMYYTYSTCTVSTVHVLYLQYMYCWWNVFDKQHVSRKMIWKKWHYFLKIFNFPICSKTMLMRTAPFLRSISMRKRLISNFLAKCGWYIPFST